MKHLVISVTTGVLVGIALSYALLAKAEPLIYIAEQEPKIEIKVEVETEKDKIIRLIKETFPDAPIMLEVARCESGYKNVPGQLSDDFGPLQINVVHLPVLEKMGLDRTKVEDNIKFARYLYDRGGLTPWKNSKACWSPSLAS